VLDYNPHDTILVVTQLAALVLLAYMFHAAHQSKLARKHELSKQILEKMSSEEFLDLLKSRDARRSIERLIGSYKSPDEWVKDAIRRAILLLFAAPAFITVYALTDFSGHEIFLVLGCLCVGVGIGYLIASAFTRGRARREGADPAP